MRIETIITTIIGLAGMSWIIVELLKLSKSVGRIEGRLDKVELRLDNVDKRLDNMDKKFDNIDKKFDNIDKRFEALPCSIHLASITELQMNLLEIKTFLKTRFPSAKAISSGKNSPTELNEYGLKIFADMGGDDFLRQHGDYFLQEMELLNPKTALDVENVAVNVLLLATGNDMFNQIKVKVYHYPSMDIINRCGQTERYDVSLDDVCFALSLKLRDKYLETHPSVMV